MVAACGHMEFVGAYGGSVWTHGGVSWGLMVAACGHMVEFPGALRWQHVDTWWSFMGAYGAACGHVVKFRGAYGGSTWTRGGVSWGLEVAACGHALLIFIKYFIQSQYNNNIYSQ